MTVIALKNWKRHQHYSDRESPPWVKLYRDILTSESWVGEGSTDLSRLLQVACILLAARYSNEIPRAWNVLRKVTNLDCTEAEFEAALAHLIASGFLEIQDATSAENIPEHSASSKLDECLHKERREEKRRKEERESARADVPRGTQDAGTALTGLAEETLAELLNSWRDVDGVCGAAMLAWLSHWSRAHGGKEMPSHQRIAAAKLLAGLGDADTQRRAVATAEANGWKALRHGDGRKPPARKGDIDHEKKAEAELREWRVLRERAGRVKFREPTGADDLLGYRTLVERAESQFPASHKGPRSAAELLARTQ